SKRLAAVGQGAHACRLVYGESDVAFAELAGHVRVAGVNAHADAQLGLAGPACLCDPPLSAIGGIDRVLRVVEDVEAPVPDFVEDATAAFEEGLANDGAARLERTDV